MERDKKIELIVTAAELGFLAAVLVFGFSREVKDYARRVENGQCACCGTNQGIEIHHICHQGIAKKFDIPASIYNHPANSQALCSDCHTKLHKQQEKLSEVDQIQMIRDLFKTVTRFLLDERQLKSARWINQGRQLAMLRQPREKLQAIREAEDNFEALLDEKSQQQARKRRDKDQAPPKHQNKPPYRNSGGLARS